MEKALTVLRQTDSGAIERVDARDLEQRGSALLKRCGERAENEGVVRILDLRRNPMGKLAGALAALEAPRRVHWFLGAPHWTEAEVARAVQIARPHRVVNADGAQAKQAPEAGAAEFGDKNLLMIPTGGTGGRIRFAIHTGETLAAAARGVVAWLGGRPVESVCFLPMHHVSGLMQVMRSWVSGGRLVLCDWKRIEAGVFPSRCGDGVRVTSLVPTQLARLLRVQGGVEWLRGFEVVFLGGAAAPRELLDQARGKRIRLAPCYGMTETAAQVAAMRPAAFLNGATGVGRALPHARVSVEEGTGLIEVEAASLFYGYYPEFARRARWVTSDRGELDSAGNLRILGRADRVINTGGEKVAADALERALLAIPGVRDAVVIGRADPEWGEVVEAVVVGEGGLTEQGLQEALRKRVSPHAVPKRITFVDAIPRNELGKIDQRALTALRTGGN